MGSLNPAAAVSTAGAAASIVRTVTDAAIVPAGRSPPMPTSPAAPSSTR